MGTGSGEIAIACAKRGTKVTAVDIDARAVARLRRIIKDMKLDIKVIQSDLFENIEEKFDTIIFNPPYLPGNPREIEDYQWAGGEKYGDEIIMRFLGEANEYLKDNGYIFIVLSSFNRLKKIFSYDYVFNRMAVLKLSFHEIYIYRLQKA